MAGTISKDITGDVPKKPSLLGAGLVLLFVSMTTYFLVRAVFIAYADYTWAEKALGIVFFLAEAFIIFHAIGYFGVVYRLNRASRSHPPVLSEGELPPVAILIPARHEPRAVLESTLVTCYNVKYPDKTVYVLDDSSDEACQKEAEELARHYGARLFRRAHRHGAKAGVINDCMKTLTEKYVVIFDVDQNPLPNFLMRLVPMLEANPKLAFVQTPQFYSNAGANKIAFAATMQQAVFYEYVCEGKSSDRAMICCGTNVVLRREALVAVGGFDESSVTEDFATSLKLHLSGWDSLYYNHVYTFGAGPENLGAYFKQQARWAMGNVGVFRAVIGRILRRPRALGLLQWWEYVVTGSYYLVGWAYLFLLLCPIAYLLFNIPSFFMNPTVYTLTFVPYLALSMAIFYTSMFRRNYGIRQVFAGQLLGMLTLPVYMRASLLGAAGVRGRFQVTAKNDNKPISYFSLWPQLLLWGLSLAAVTWGANRFVYERTAAIGLNLAWVTFHFAQLSSIFYYNE